MSGPSESETALTGNWGARLAESAAFAWIVGCMSILVNSGHLDNAALTPSIGLDVALVCALWAFPLGLIMVFLAARCQDAATFLIQCIFSCSVSVTFLIAISQQAHWTGFAAGGTAGYFIRPLGGLILVWPSCWLWTLGHWPASVSTSRLWTWLLTTLCLAILLPGIYVVARCRQDVTRCQELLGQSRLGEAAVVLHRLRWLAPRTRVQDQPVSLVIAKVDRSVKQLQAAVTSMPKPDAPAEAWLLRARQLAMLGQTELALKSLAAIPNPGPDAKVLSGTIRETRAEWRLAVQDYTEAKQDWDASDDSAVRTAGRIQATRGIAYCLRKQGRYPEAERAYRELLDLSPTADTHFLLAQFYEDTQQTTLARQHARQAMDLAPDRYAESGKRLINKLTTMHFGCFL